MFNCTVRLVEVRRRMASENLRTRQGRKSSSRIRMTCRICSFGQVFAAFASSSCCKVYRGLRSSSARQLDTLEHVVSQRFQRFTHYALCLYYLSFLGPGTNSTEILFQFVGSVVWGRWLLLQPSFSSRGSATFCYISFQFCPSTVSCICLPVFAVLCLTVF